MFGFIPEKLQLAGSTFFAQGMRVCTMLVMARLLTPADYGAYSLVIALPGLLISLGDFAIPSSIVQVREFSEEVVVDTALALLLVIYTVYGLIIVSGGAYLAVRRADHRLLFLSIIFAVTNLCGAVYLMQLARLNRRLAFGAQSRQNFIFATSQALAGMSLAMLGAGVYALAFQGLVAQLVASTVIVMRAPLRWPRHATWAAARHLLSLGGKVSLATYITTVPARIVELLIARSIGVEALGVWGRAAQIQNLFSQNLMASVEGVIYPLLCNARGDQPRMRSLFTRGAVALMSLAAFSTVWLCIGSREVVRFVLGPQWSAMPPILSILALSIPAGAVFSIGYNTSYALGKTGNILRSTIVNVLVFLPLIPVAIRWKLPGLAYWSSGSDYFTALVIIVPIIRRLRPDIGHLLVRMSYLMCAAVGGGLVVLAARYFHPEAMRFWVFVAATLADGLIYLSIVLLTQRDLLQLLRGSPRPVGVAAS